MKAINSAKRLVRKTHIQKTPVFWCETVVHQQVATTAPVHAKRRKREEFANFALSKVKEDSQ